MFAWGKMCNDIRRQRKQNCWVLQASFLDCAERKFFVLVGELQEVVSKNGSQKSRALSLSG